MDLSLMFSGDYEIFDLGCYLDQAAYPPWGFSAKFVDHKQGAKAMSHFLNLRQFQSVEGGIGAKDGVDQEDFPESLGLSWTHVSMSDHTGNHIDAPSHFGPLVEGRPAKSIDQVPLSWCMGQGLRLDFRELQGRDIEVSHIEQALQKIEAPLLPGTIPLLWTGADEYIDNDEEYWKRQAGLSLAGLNYFLDYGVKMIAIDAYAMDVSHATMQTTLKDDQPQFFPAHFAGRKREHLHLEKLVGLGQLPVAKDFLFMAFPVKLRGGSAGWVRPVALVKKI